MTARHEDGIRILLETDVAFVLKYLFFLLLLFGQEHSLIISCFLIPLAYISLVIPILFLFFHISHRLIWCHWQYLNSGYLSLFELDSGLQNRVQCGIPEGIFEGLIHWRQIFLIRNCQLYFVIKSFRHFLNGKQKLVCKILHSRKIRTRYFVLYISYH